MNDILDGFHISSPKAETIVNFSAFSAPEQQVLIAISAGFCDIDSILEKISASNTASVLAILTALELSGILCQTESGTYALTR